MLPLHRRQFLTGAAAFIGSLIQPRWAWAKRKPRPPATTTTSSTLMPSGTTTTTIRAATGSGESARVLALLAVRPNCPQSPPVNFSGNGSGNGPDAWRLVGPSSAPGGAITCTAGVHDIAALTNANPAGSTFWLSPGVHKFLNVDNPTDENSALFAQIKAKTNNTYIGAPGAILDGQNPSFPTKYARIHFTGANGAANTDITIKTLEIRNFRPDVEQYSANVDNAAGWLWEGVYLHDNNNGINIGTNGVLRHCWLRNNGQYGCATYSPPVSNGLACAITNVEIDHCEISENGTWQDEFATGGSGPLGSGAPTGNGRNGGMKFWDTEGMNIHHCYIHHNEYTAIWADTNNINLTVADNWISDNYGIAVFYEISYNFGVQRNTLLRNAIFLGKNFAARNDSFPVPAIYISEAGGDSTVHATWADSYIGGTTTANGNAFIDNWGEVDLWQNPDRFCNSPNNTSHKIWKPRHTVNGVLANLQICNVPTVRSGIVVAVANGSPDFTWVSGTAFEPYSSLGRSSDEGRVVTVTTGTPLPGGTKIWEPTSAAPLDGPTSRGLIGAHGGAGAAIVSGRFTNAYTGTSGNITISLAAGTINAEDAYTACYWPTKNVKIRNNLFALDPDIVKAEFPGVTLNGREPGKVAVFSVPGSSPSWSPYKSDGPFGANEIQDRITFEAGNVWSDNDYRGAHAFMPYETVSKTFAQWQAAPYNQDAGSTLT